MNLLEITKRNSAIGPLIEENIVLAPTWGRVPVKMTRKLTYKQLVRKTRPNGAFNDVGEGYSPTSGSYDVREFGLKHFGGVLKVAKSYVEAQQDEVASGVNDILMDEQNGFVQQQLIDYDKQFFWGADSGVTGAAKGYAGLKQLVDTSMTFGMQSDTTGSWAWIVMENDNEGVSYLMKEGSNIDMSPWEYKQDMLMSATGTSITTAPGYISTSDGYIGLKAGSPDKVIAVVKGITKSNPMTDKVVQAVMSKFKGIYRPTAIYANTNTRLWLTSSRNVVTVTNANGRAPVRSGEIVADLATESNGIPIVITDSLPTDSAAAVAGDVTRLTDLISL